MKTGKKLLSLFLSLVMMFSMVSISFSTFTVSAVDGNDLKAAFDAVTDTSLTNGDGTLLNAAEVLYNYVYGIAKTNCNGVGGNGSSATLTAVANNSSVDLNNSAKKAAGSEYASLINSLIPTSGVTDDSSASRKNGDKVLDTWTCQTNPGFNESWVSYNINSNAAKSVTVTADLEKTLLTFASLSDVPESILLGATYGYNNTVRKGYARHNEDTKKWGALTKRVWRWSSLSWHTLSQKPTRTNVKTNTEAYKDLHAFADYFTADRLSTTLNALVDLSASQISEIIENNTTYLAKLDSYSENVKKHFFDMTAVNAYIDNCIFAQKIINARPAMESLGNAMNSGYDINDLEQMNSIYTAQQPNFDFLKTVDSSVIEYVQNNFDGFSQFSVENAEIFITQLAKDIQLYNIREIKTAVDELRALYPDAEAIRNIDDDQLLWNCYDLIKGYNTALSTSFDADNVAEVFTDGTDYVAQFEEQLKYEWDYREAETQYETFWSWFLPLVYADLTRVSTEDIIGNGVAQNVPNIPNAVSKQSSFSAMYEKYVALIGEVAMETIFGSGENALGYIIEDYIARLYATILARLESEVNTAVGYYDAYGEVNLNNFTAIKDAVGRVETNIWNYINANNSSIISDQLRTDYSRLSSLLSNYNSFVASGGLSNFKQQHLHDSNGVFMTRDVTDEDLARKSGEEYNVTEDIVNETITKLDAFLTSEDFTHLVNIDTENLTDYIKQVLADNLYTNDFVNMIIQLLYPELVKAFEDMYRSLPNEYSYGSGWSKIKINIGYKSLTDLISGLNLGVYPNQVANYIDGFPSVRNRLSSAGQNWNSLVKNGKYDLDWGIDNIKPENYSTTDAFIAAKKAKFISAMSESFDAILPMVRALLGDWDGYNEKVNKAGYGEVVGIKLNADLTVTAEGCSGYADFITPILEALNCDKIPTNNTLKGYSTSRQFVNAIFDPLIDFIENKFAAAPVSTLCDVLPNLAYAIPMDKLWEKFKYLNIRINYKADDSILGIQVISDHYDIKFTDFVSKDSIDFGFDVSSFSSIISYLVGMFIPDFDSSTLPVMNAGELITYASLNKNAPTKRINGNRIKFTADKPDVFMAVLDYLTRCLGNSDFVDIIFKQFSKDEEMSEELKTIIENIYTSTSDERGNMALAAIIELLNQTEYALEDYKWLGADSDAGTIEGVTPASKVYLSYKNDWTKQTADYVAENLNTIVSAVLKTAGSDIDLSKSISDGLNSLFTNSAVTTVAKALSSLSLPSTLTELINKELAVDLTAFETYKGLADDYSWGFVDGDRDGFTTALLAVLEPLSPLYGFIFNGENIHLFENSADVLLYGNDGYDNAVVPLLEALGCKVKDSGEFSSEETLSVVLEAIYARIDAIASDPINEILDLLPGVIYYISSGALSTAVRNLLHPIYVIIDTVRPVYEIDVASLAAEISPSMDLENLDATLVSSLVESLTGLKLERLSTLLEDIAKTIATEYDSKSKFLEGNAFKGAYVDGVFDRGDMVTVVISYLLEALEDEQNALAMDKLLGTENFTAALLSVFKGTDPEKQKINWMYYFGEDTDYTLLDFESGVVVDPTIKSLTYPNNWTAAAAEYIDNNLEAVIADVLSATGTTESLSDLLKSYLNIYTGENLEKISSTICGLINGLDETLLDTANVLLGLDLDSLENYKAPTGELTTEQFTAELSKIFESIDGIVEWLLFSEDYSFFTGTDTDEDGNYLYNDLITVKGAAGYKNGIVPVLEAIGCKNIPAADDEKAFDKAIAVLFNRIDEILDDPANELLDILPNLIYFLNADGLTASVSNILSAVDALAVSLEKLGVELDVDGLLGVDLSDLSFEKLIELVEDATELDLIEVKKMFLGLCIGTIKQYLSVSGEYAFNMSYTEPTDRKDMITLILTALVETVKLGNNEAILRKMVGDDAYDAILAVMNLRQFEMQKLNYINTEYADSDKTFSAIESSVLFSGYKYGPLYTREMAQYIADNIDDFIDNLIYLLGIEINGTYVNSLSGLLDALVNGSLYNSKNIQAILDELLSFSAKIDELDGGEHIKGLIRTSLGVDLDFWKTYTVKSFDNDRQKFTEALCDILRPLYPVLNWMLCNEDFSFFVDENENDLVTLLGAEGYAYGVIPLLEALGCNDVLTPAEYYLAVFENSDALVTAITEPLFDRIDDIMTDPAEKILEMLPQIIYFVNCNGLDTCFKNALHSVYGILHAIEPLVKVDLYSLINVRLDEITFESLYEYLIDQIAETTGQELSAIDGDAFLELTVGKLVSYTSANGEKAYKMVYQSNTAKAEMVTVIERLLISFIMNEDNRTKLVTILKTQCNMSESAEQYVEAFLELLASYTTTTHHGMDQALFAVYQIFYGANKGADHAASGLQKLNQKWQDILKELNGSDDPNAQGIGSFIGNILDATLDGIFDSDGLASNGFITFWQRIIELFRKISNFFKNLF